MSSVRLYTVVYVVLMALAIGKWAYFQVFDYWTAMAITIVSAVVKAGIIAAYFQHLRSEPRAITYVYLLGVLAVMLLGMASSYSVL